MTTQKNDMAKAIMTTMFRATKDEAYKAIRRYQKGFDLPKLRDAELREIEPGTASPEQVIMEIVGNGSRIIADRQRRRVWTDFVDGAGCDF